MSWHSFMRGAQTVSYRTVGGETWAGPGLAATGSWWGEKGEFAFTYVICVIFYSGLWMNGWWSKLGVLLETKAGAVSCALHFSSIFSVYQEILGIRYLWKTASVKNTDVDRYKTPFMSISSSYNIFKPQLSIWPPTHHPPKLNTKCWDYWIAPIFWVNTAPGPECPV